MRIPKSAAALLATGVLVFAGCGGADTNGGADEPAGAGAEQTAAVDTTAAENGEGSEAGQDDAPEGDCEVERFSSKVMDAMELAPPPPSGTVWSFDSEETNFDECSDLTYAVLIARRGTAALPTEERHLVLFHQGEYIGTATDEPNVGEVTGTTRDSVTAEVQGEGETTFRWDGSEVVTE